jgi:hypothetical protein
MLLTVTIQIAPSVPDESVDVPFTLCLQDKKPFRFFVNVLGVTKDVDLEKGLVASFPFNGNANDESGNGNDGTVHGATLTDDRFGNGNSAYSFDGNDDYIEAPSFSALNFNEISVSVWVKTVPGDINNHRIVTLDDGVDPEYHHFDIESNSGRGLDVYIDQEAVGEFDWQFENDKWTHIAVTYDGTTVYIFKDGQLTETGTRIASPRNGVLFIGGVDAPNYGAQIWDGEIDDIHIYNRVLSPAEISALYKLNE